MNFNDVLKLPSLYKITRTNCFDIAKDVALGRNGTYDYPANSNAYINCFNVNADKITLKIDPRSGSDSSDTQLVPVEVKVHKDIIKKGASTFKASVFTYPQWNNFPSAIPEGGKEISSKTFGNPTSRGNYYVFNSSITTPTTGWQSLVLSFQKTLESGKSVRLSRNRCLSINGDVVEGYEGIVNKNNPWPTDREGGVYLNCFNVDASKLTVTIDPWDFETPVGPNSLVAKYKIDTQTIAKLDRIETQMCDRDKNCELVETMGADIRPTTIVSVKNIKGEALKPDWNYEIFCTLFYTDGTQGTCEGKAISVNNPVASRISSTLFGKTTIVTKTQFESADTNGDGTVNASDVAFLLANFGTARADINLDDNYDTLDLTTGYKWLGTRP